MCIMTLEDLGESYEVVLWKEFLVKARKENKIFNKGSVVLLSGYKGKSPKGESQLSLGRESGTYIKILKE